MENTENISAAIELCSRMALLCGFSRVSQSEHPKHGTVYLVRRQGKIMHFRSLEKLQDSLERTMQRRHLEGSMGRMYRYTRVSIP